MQKYQHQEELILNHDVIIITDRPLVEGTALGWKCEAICVDAAITVGPQYKLYAYKRELVLLTQTQFNRTIPRDDRINQGHSYIRQSGHENHQPKRGEYSFRSDSLIPESAQSNIQPDPV